MPCRSPAEPQHRFWLGRAALACALAIPLAGCDQGGDGPLERVGNPLPVAGHLPSDGGTDRGDGPITSDEAPATDGAPAPDTGPARPLPAKALAAAARADAAARRGDLDDALEGYGRAATLDPTSSWIGVGHAWLLSRAGRLGDAREQLDRALDHADPEDDSLTAAAHMALGELQEARGDMTRAQESYRLALRARSIAPIARALLRVIPATSPRQAEVRRLAHGDVAPPWPGGIPPRSWATGDVAAPGAWPLALVSLEGGRAAAVVAHRRPPGSDLASGWAYRLIVGGGAASADAGTLRHELEIAEAHAVRWHEGAVERVDLGRGRTGLLVTLRRTDPGAGGPTSRLSTLVAANDDGLEQLLSRQTASERDRPIGCRRGWRSELSLDDGDGDGAPDSATFNRTDFVRARLSSAGPTCTEQESRRPPRTIALGTGRPAPSAPPSPDGGVTP